MAGIDDSQMSEPIRCFHFDHSYDAHSITGGGPCCFVRIPGVNSFQQLHQHADYIKIKQHFANGQWPEKYCNECKTIEESSAGVSKRQHSSALYEKVTNRHWRAHNCQVPAVDTMYSLIVNTGPLCNLQCRTCSPWLSSSWIKEYNQLPNEFQIFGKSLNLEKVKTWPGQYYQFDDELSCVRELGLIGGEPMYNADSYNLLEKVYHATNGNTTITFTTNGTILFDNKKYPWLDKFKSIVLIVSLDASGQASNFIRTGSTWSTIEKNIQEYIKMPNIRVEYHPTYSVLNIFEIDRLKKWAESIGIVATNEITYVEHPRHFSYNILTDVEKITAVEYLTSVGQYTVANRVTESTFEPKERSKFIRLMKHTKTYHDMDWKDYLPELYNLLNKTCP